MKISGRKCRSARRWRRWSSSAITPITPELLEWLRTFKHAPKQTFLVHGEPAAATQLRDTMIEALRWNVQVAAYKQKVEVE